MSTYCPYPQQLAVSTLRVSVDEKTGYVLTIPISTKSSHHINGAFNQIAAFYRVYGHTVKKWISDNENNFQDCVFHQRVHQRMLTHTPSGLHEKRSERYIQTLKGRHAAQLAHLPYVLPTLLIGLSYESCAYTLNLLPNSLTSTRSPHELVTHTKPRVPPFAFGTIGLALDPKTLDPTFKASPAIFINSGSTDIYLRVYVPLRQRLIVTRSFQPMRPLEAWNYKR